MAEVVFRSAIGGYNKEDVNGYISKMVTKFNATLRDHEAETAQCEKKLAQSRAETGELSERIGDLEAKIAEYDGVIREKDAAITGREAEAAELRDKNKSLENKMFSLSGELARSESELSSLRKELGDLREKMNAQFSGGPIEKITEKTSLYDQLSSRIGQTLLAANRTADEITEEARREAERIITETGEEIVSQKEKAARITSAAVENVVAGLRKLTEDYITDFRNFTCEADENFSALINRLNETRRAMSEKANGMVGSVSEIISGKLAKLSGEDEVNLYINLDGDKQDV